MDNELLSGLIVTAYGKQCLNVYAAIYRLSNLLARATTWSSYKLIPVIFLIGITPQVTVSFDSEVDGGRVSDKFLTEFSGILDYLLPKETVLDFNISDTVGMMQQAASFTSLYTG